MVAPPPHATVLATLRTRLRQPSRRSRRLAVALAAAGVLSSTGTAALAADDPYQVDQYALRQIAAPAAWQAARGAGVTIAVVDTGVDLSHEDLVGKLVAGHDFVDGDDTPSDGHGHGTMIAGLGAAATGNGVGIAGTAPDARIMPVRVIAGTIRPEDEEPCRAADGIRWAADHGARVINVSLTSEVDFVRFVFSCSLEQAMNYAWNKGSLVVAAAGNSQDSSSSAPSGYASDVKAVIVTAVDAESRQPSYANKADTTWSLAAPGDKILSTFAGGQYRIASGTSMATPHVAGVAALLFSRGLTNSQVVDRLLSTARPLPGTVGTGRGLVDAAAAVGAPAAPPPTVPTATVAPTTRAPRRPGSTSSPALPPATGAPVTEPPTTQPPASLAPEVTNADGDDGPIVVAAPAPSVAVRAGSTGEGAESSGRGWFAATAGAMVLVAAAALWRIRRHA